MARWTVHTGSGAGCSGLAGKVVFTVFCLPFLGLGAWFTYLVARSTVASLAVYTWEETECSIDASEAATVREAGEADSPHRFTVRYRWVAFGREYTGDRYRPGYDGSDDVAEAQRLAARYPAGSTALCYVDPGDPSRAYLVRPNPLVPGCFIVLPLLFVAAGAGGILLSWLPRGRLAGRFGLRVASAEELDDGGRTIPAGGSISKRARNALAGTGCLAGFFLVFALFGGAFLVPFFVFPALRVTEARGWTPVPCTIESSSVESHAGDDGPTFSVAVLYRYEIAGRTIQGSRYGFMGGSSSGYRGKARIVERLPAGTETTCYVDPDDPYNAVLERSFTPDFLFGLIPLVFVFVGLGGATFALRSGLRKRRREAGDEPSRLALSARPAAPAAAPAGPLTLRPSAGPWAKLLGTLFVAAFWNGITGVFVWKVAEGWRQGAGDGCATVFLVPFVLVGLVLLVAVPYQLLASFNPRPLLTLSSATVALGGSAQLDWRFSGAAGRIRRLSITLEGREEASRRQGKSSHTERSTFARQVLAATDQRWEIGRGSAVLAVPEGAMHSFAANHNKVVWTLKVQGEIRRWPDVAEEFPLTVTAPEAGR